MASLTYSEGCCMSIVNSDLFASSYLCACIVSMRSLWCTHILSCLLLQLLTCPGVHILMHSCLYWLWIFVTLLPESHLPEPLLPESHLNITKSAFTLDITKSDSLLISLMHSHSQHTNTLWAKQRLLDAFCTACSTCIRCGHAWAIEQFQHL